MESRRLLSAYIPSTIGTFNTSNGATPDAGLVIDSSGNLYGTTSAGGTAGDGTVFKIAAGTSVITTIASFTGTNGQNPMGRLYRDSTGTLWGTTVNGGATGYGSVFKIVSGSSTITTVASFVSTGLYSPTGNLVADAAGDLFGVCTHGLPLNQGGLNQGGIFEIAHNSSSITTVAASTNGVPQSVLTIDSAGNLYGATAYGGGNGTVFEVVKGSGVVTTRVTFVGNGTGVSQGYLPNGGLVVDSSGNLFGALYANANLSGNGYLFEVSAGSYSATLIGFFNSTNGANPTGGLVMDAAGDLFGTTRGGTGGASVVYEYNHGTLSDVASFGPTGAITDTNPNGQLLIDPAGDLIGTTSQGGASNVGTVFKLTAANSFVFAQMPGTITAGAVFSPAVKINLLDPSGNLMSTSSASVTLSTASGTALSGTTTVAAVNGVATFSNLSLTRSGTYVLVASATGFGNGSSSSINVNPGAAAKLAYTNPIRDVIAGQTLGFSGYVSLTLQDAYGNNVQGDYSDSVSIALAANPGSAVLRGTTTVNAGGIGVTFSDLSITTATSGYTLVAKDNTNTAVATATSSAFSVLPQPFTFASIFAFNGTDSSYPSGAPLFDSAGNLYGTAGNGGVNQHGAIFKFGTPAGYVAPVYYNGLAGGTGPNGGLVADKSGDLFGVTTSGVFEIPTGSTTPVSIGGTNGTMIGPVAVNSAGDVFGVTQNGGTYGYGSVYKITAGSGTATTLYSFNSTDGYEPFSGVIIDPAGDVFGTTLGGGTGGTIFEVPAGSNTLKIVAPLTGTAQGGLSQDAAGDLFGTTQAGGTYGDGQIYELPKGASAVTVLASFNQSNGAMPYAPPAVDQAGNLFGTTYLGGNFNQGVFYELPHGQSTPIVYYSFSAAAGDDAVFPLTFDAKGNLWGLTRTGGLNGYGTLFEIRNGEQLKVLQQPANTLVNKPITPAPKIELTDTYGNVMTADTSAVHLTINTGPAGGALAGTTTVTLVSGIATFSNLSVNTSGGYLLLAQTVATQSVQNYFNPFSTSGAPAAIKVISGSNQYAAPGSKFANQLKVQVTDASGNAVAGASVSFTVPTTGATAQIPGPLTTDINGYAQQSAIAEGTSGAYTVTANVAGVATGAAFSLYNSGELVLTVPTYLKLDADHLRVDVYNNSSGAGSPAQQVPLGQITDIYVQGTTAAQSLTADFSAGDPIPSGGLGFGNFAAPVTVIGTPGADSVVATNRNVTVNGALISVTLFTFVPGGGVDSLNVSGGSLTLAAPLLSTSAVESFSSLTLNNYGSLDASAPASGGRADVLVAAAVTLGTGLTINLGGNAMDLAGVSLSTVNALAKTGDAIGQWNGTGIRSSSAASDTTHLTAVGVIQNNQSGSPLFSSAKLFDGVAPGPSDILVKYTYYGDANFDGKVDGADYTRIDAGYASNGGLAGWYNGDFNYDGVIDGSDYALIDNAFNNQRTAIPTALVAATAARLPKPSFAVPPSSPPTPAAAWPVPFTPNASEDVVDRLKIRRR